MTEKSTNPTRNDIILTTTYVFLFPTTITLTPPHPHICDHLYDRIPLPTVRESLWDELILLCDWGLYIVDRASDAIPVPTWRHHPSPRE